MPQHDQAMRERIVDRGVARDDEIAIDGLERRLAAERGTGAVYISDMAFGAWGRKS